MEEVLKGIGVVLAIAAWRFYEKWNERRQRRNKTHDGEIIVIERIHEEVVKHEHRIREYCRAMRMYVMHFSNGTFTEAGLPLAKVTFKHEILEGYYVEPIQMYFQEQPMPEMFFEPIKAIRESDVYYLKDVDDLLLEVKNGTDDKDYNKTSRKEYFDWLIRYRVKATLWLALKGKDGKTKSILVCHFPHAHPLNDADIAGIKDMKKKIEQAYHPYEQKN